LAREGAKVVITDIDDAGAQAAVGKIVAAGGKPRSTSTGCSCR